MKVTELKTKGVKLFEFDKHEDDRGILTVANFESEIPFIPQRVFLVYGVPANKNRGEHAHKVCHEFLICSVGSCKVLVDDGVNRETIILDKPTIGLHLPANIWRVQYDYSANSCLLAFASHLYNDNDYIRSYDEFKLLFSKK